MVQLSVRYRYTNCQNSRNQTETTATERGMECLACAASYRCLGLCACGHRFRNCGRQHLVVPTLPLQPMPCTTAIRPLRVYNKVWPPPFLTLIVGRGFHAFQARPSLAAVATEKADMLEMLLMSSQYTEIHNRDIGHAFFVAFMLTAH